MLLSVACVCPVFTSISVMRVADRHLHNSDASIKTASVCMSKFTYHRVHLLFFFSTSNGGYARWIVCNSHWPFFLSISFFLFVLEHVCFQCVVISIKDPPLSVPSLQGCRHKKKRKVAITLLCVAYGNRVVDSLDSASFFHKS